MTDVRFLYLLVDETSPSPERIERRLRQGQAAVPEGWRFDVRSIQIGPGYYEENALGHAMAVPGIVHAILTYQSAYDAVLIGCFGDPGLAAARAVADIPVIGPAEASFVLVRLTARRFGLVTMGDTDLPELDTYLTPAGTGYVGAEPLDMPIGDVFADVSLTIERLLRAGRLLRARGAQAIVLGCMSLGFYPFADELSRALGIGVVDPLRASIAALQVVQTLGVRLGPAPAAIERPAALKEFLAKLEGAIPVS